MLQEKDPPFKDSTSRIPREEARGVTRYDTAFQQSLERRAEGLCVGFCMFNESTHTNCGMNDEP